MWHRPPRALVKPFDYSGAPLAGGRPRQIIESPRLALSKLKQPIDCAIINCLCTTMPGHSVMAAAVWGPTGSPSELAEAVRALDSPAAFAPAAGVFSAAENCAPSENEVRVLLRAVAFILHGVAPHPAPAPLPDVCASAG